MGIRIEKGPVDPFRGCAKDAMKPNDITPHDDVLLS